MHFSKTTPNGSTWTSLKFPITEVTTNPPSLLRHIKPNVALQSCGWLRLERDQWTGDLPDVERLITARDGACVVEVSDDGTITTGRYLTPR
jgi:hypothetical protein